MDYAGAASNNNISKMHFGNNREDFTVFKKESGGGDRMLSQHRRNLIGRNNNEAVLKSMEVQSPTWNKYGVVPKFPTVL